MLKASGRERKRYKEITLDGDSTYFDKTPYAGQDFSVTLRWADNTTLDANDYAEAEAVELYGKEYLEEAKEKYTVAPAIDEEGNVIQRGTTKRDYLINRLFNEKWLLIVSIVDWEGIGDDLGEELECTTENKEYIYKDESFTEFNECLFNALSDLVKPTKAEEKAEETTGELSDISDGSTDLETEILD